MKPEGLPNIESQMRQRIITVFMAMMMLCHPLSPLTSVGQCSSEILSAAAPLAQTPKTAKEIEYDIKAAFIYNFMKFVEWPASKKSALDQKQGRPATMIIGILGENPFRQSFRPILHKTIQGRAIQLVQIQSYQAFRKKTTDKRNVRTAYRDQYQETIQKCDILFICKPEKDALEDILSLVHGSSVLTVSDIPGFAKKDGMIGFVTESKKVRFEINLNAVTEAEIKIRSQLLGLARKIYKNKQS